MTTSWVRLALVLVAVGSAAFYFSPEGETVVASIESSVRSATQEQSIQPETETAPTARRADTARSAAWAAARAALAAPPLPTEICEFLARPAARLYIDGKLVSKEIPPIFRTELAIGEHTVRFVSVTNRTRELRIQVVEGSPTRWVMNWVENRVGQRSLDRHEELGG